MIPNDDEENSTTENVGLENARAESNGGIIGIGRKCVDGQNDGKLTEIS